MTQKLGLKNDRRVFDRGGHWGQLQTTRNRGMCGCLDGRFGRSVRVRGDFRRFAGCPGVEEDRLRRAQAKRFQAVARPVHIVLAIPTQISRTSTDQRQHDDVDCQRTEDRLELRAPIDHDAVEEFQLRKRGGRGTGVDGDSQSQVGGSFQHKIRKRTVLLSWQLIRIFTGRNGESGSVAGTWKRTASTPTAAPDGPAYRALIVRSLTMMVTPSFSVQLRSDRRARQNATENRHRPNNRLVHDRHRFLGFQEVAPTPTRNTKSCIQPLNLLLPGVARRLVGSGVA